MKKLMTLMLGMALAFTVVSPTFAAQDKPTKAKTTKAKSTKAKTTKAKPTKA